MYVKNMHIIWCRNYDEQWIMDRRLFKNYQEAEDFLRSKERELLHTAHYHIEELYLEE